MQLKALEPYQPVSIILKLVGDVCNIDCSYCYEKRKPYESFARITPEIIRNVLSQFSGHPLAIELHGGEPLLIGKQRLAEILQELKNHDANVSVSLQTNGLLLDSGWVDFLQSTWPGLTIGVSLDGGSDINDFRLDYRGKSTSSKVESNLRLLELKRIDVGVICVVNSKSLHKAEEILQYFESFSCVKVLKFAPCFDYNVVQKPSAGVRSLLNIVSSGIAKPDWAISPLEYSAFLISAYDHWSKGAYAKFLIEPFISIIRVIHGNPSHSCHFNERKCAHVFTVYPSGEVGSCDELPYDFAELEMKGELSNGLPAITNESRFEMDEILEKCDSCSYKSTCGGGCIATRLRYRGTDYYEDYCIYRIAIIDRIQNDNNLRMS